MSKTCINCKKIFMKPEKYFGKDKKRKDGLNVYCKECTRNMQQYYTARTYKQKDIKKCEHCDKEFATAYKHKKFCCKKCRLKKRLENNYDKIMTRRNFLKRFNRKKEIVINSKKHWASEEIGILLEMRDKGYSYKEIGAKLGRSSCGCEWKYNDTFKKIQRGENCERY